MFDDVPARVWLLLGIAALAYAPLRYLLRHIAHAPSRREITRPREDLSWRTSGTLIRSLALLAGLAVLAVFIFTPTAEELARSDYLLPSLSVALGAFALFSVAQSTWTGRIQPFVRGLSESYSRDAQPKRYWASVAWNACLGSIFVWLAYNVYDDTKAQAAWAECAAESAAPRFEEKLASCDEVVARYPNDAQAHINRGLRYLDNGYLDEAVSDFSRAHELDPKNRWALANRGITYAWQGDHPRAEADFARVRAVDPENVVVLRGEVLLNMNLRELNAAEDQLTELLRLYPDDQWALYTRAEVYRQLGETEKANADHVKLSRLIKAKQDSLEAG